MLRLSGYLPSDHVESHLSENQKASTSDQAGQKAMHLWHNTHHYRRRMKAIDTSYDKETLYCEQSIILKQANFDINRIRQSYTVISEKDQEKELTCMQHIGATKLKCDNSKENKDILFNAVYDLEYQKEFIIAQPKNRKEPNTVATFRSKDGILGSIPVKFSYSNDQIRHENNTKSTNKSNETEQVTIAMNQKCENKELNKKHALSNNILYKISSLAAAIAKNYNNAVNNQIESECDDKSDNKYVRGYKIEIDRSHLRHESSQLTQVNLMAHDQQMMKKQTATPKKDDLIVCFEP